MAFNRQIPLKSRPIGMPQRDNFDIVDAPLPETKDGEVLAKNLFLSVDPYMRSTMNEVTPRSFCRQLRGEITRIWRLPGGSSNPCNRVYCQRLSVSQPGSFWNPFWETLKG